MWAAVGGAALGEGVDEGARKALFRS
jgi:hypothetical protein